MKILCTLPNASHLISGVAFEDIPGVAGVVSRDDLPDDIAQGFLGISGYAPHFAPAPPAPPVPPPPQGTDGAATDLAREPAGAGVATPTEAPPAAESPARPAARTAGKGK